jgi:hypothetical protein
MPEYGRFRRLTDVGRLEIGGTGQIQDSDNQVNTGDPAKNLKSKPFSGKAVPSGTDGSDQICKLNHTCCRLQSSRARRKEILPYSGRAREADAILRKLMDRTIVEQNGVCPICHEEFTDYGDIVPDHKNPKGMGGAWRDDHPDNIQATHWWCNEEKGSTRMDEGRPIIQTVDFLAVKGAFTPVTMLQ